MKKFILSLSFIFIISLVVGCAPKDRRCVVSGTITSDGQPLPTGVVNFSPIDPDGCEIDRIHSKAYLHHLFKAQELLAMQIASIHNLAFYLRLVTDARQHILDGDFVQWKRSVINQLGQRR